MKYAHASIFLLLFLTIIGCKEDRPEGLPKLHSVTLIFQQEGVALDEASIRLIPQFDSPWAVGGSTNAKGEVRLKTHGKYDGVPAGQYKICVNKFVSEGELAKIGESATPMRHFNLVETKFTLPNQTPLEIEVVDGRNSFPPFDLGKADRVELIAPK